METARAPCSSTTERRVRAVPVAASGLAPTRSDDKVVVLVTGTDLKFGNVELSRGGVRRMHLVVLQAR